MNLEELVQETYNNTIRQYLPRKFRVANGVAVKDIRLFDKQDWNPNFKQGLVTAIKDCVDQDDSVELVGFGMGVSSTHILKRAPKKLIAYEGAEEMIERGKHTVGVNECDTKPLEIRNAIVGEGLNIWGNSSSANKIPVSSLSTSDVLILDCEGAEKGILTSLGTLPETIICESHPGHDAPTDKVEPLFPEVYKTEIREYEPNTFEGKDIIVGHID